MKSKLFFNALLRSLIETYLKVSISAMAGLQSINLNGDSGTVAKSILTLVLLLGFVVGFPLATYFFLKAKKSVLLDEANVKRFGSLYLNLDLEGNPKAWLMTPLFLLRRFIFAFSVNFLGTPCSLP